MMKSVKVIQPGNLVDLLFYDMNKKRLRARTTYIGCVEDQFLLLQFPKLIKDKRDLNYLKSGVRLEVRALTDKRTMDYVIFATTVKSVTNFMLPVLVLNYPSQVQSSRLRAEPRLEVELIAEVHIPGQEAPMIGLITDLSQSGLRLECQPQAKGEQPTVAASPEQEHPTAPPDEGLIGQKVTLKFASDFDEHHSENITGHIRNFSYKDKAVMGIQFCQTEADRGRELFTHYMLELQ